jgi:hypothetical protein
MAARLDVGKVVVGAFVVPWWNRKAFARALAVPLAATAALSLASQYFSRDVPTFATWLLVALSVVVFCLFAVICHRLVLLDPTSEARSMTPRWSYRETRFFLLMIAVWFIGVAVLLIVSTVLMNVPDTWLNSLPGPGRRRSWISFVAVLPVLYVVARLSLIFPATAVDRRVNLLWSWRLTQNNGWRLFLVVAVLPWAVSQAVDLFHRSDATALETLALALIGSATFAVEVAALSLSYRELTKDEAVSP